MQYEDDLDENASWVHLCICNKARGTGKHFCPFKHKAGEASSLDVLQKQLDPAGAEYRLASVTSRGQMPLGNMIFLSNSTHCILKRGPSLNYYQNISKTIFKPDLFRCSSFVVPL